MSKIEEKYSKELIQKVFIHELGHYLANKINHENGQLFYPIGILLYPFEDNSSELIGEIERGDFDIRRDFPTKERFGQYTARLLMGCVFQAYYLNNDMYDECLKSNGKCDYKEIRDLRGGFTNGSSFKASRLFDIEGSFIKRLREDEDLGFLFNLNALDFIGEMQEDNKWHINLEKLEKELKHHDYSSFKGKYLTFIEKLNKIISD